jgi:hypothetical protein
LEEKVACPECGALISASTARRMKGLCVLCKTKHKTTNPLSLLYLSLIQRVHDSPGGFAALGEAEKLFYALSLFRNEINNGGFEQFFRNSSGSYYQDIESGLARLDESQNLEPLRHAKQIVFPTVPVPADRKPGGVSCRNMEIGPVKRLSGLRSSTNSIDVSIPVPTL